MKYPSLIGLCKNCLGCMRLEDPKFKGVYKCKWNQNKNKKEKQFIQERTWK